VSLIKLSEIPVVLLAGGLGTRMREASELLPKPMIAIGGKPILWHIIRNFQFQGFRNFIICGGYKVDVIKNYFINLPAFTHDFTIDFHNESMKIHGNYEKDFSITICDTGENTNTGGRIHSIEPYIQSNIFLVTYGDGLANLNLNELLSFHDSHKKIATVSASKPISRFGLLNIDVNRKVESFKEKPKMKDWVSIGYFVFNKEIFRFLNPNSVLEIEVMQNLSASGELMAYLHEGFWQAMDTPREASLLNDIWSSKNAPWCNW